MNHQILTPLLYFYGFFLIVCGVVSVIFIGAKAKTAVMSGGTSGVISIVIGYLISIDTNGARMAGIVVSLALFIVFAWRSAKTLFKIFELIPSASGQDELKGKGIAFLIISLMAVVSIVVFMLQVLVSTL
jgi:hypothetical protein